MNKHIKAALAAILALLLALTVVPASALPRFEAKAEVEPCWTVPAGYNVHDYTKCVEFLEQTDENGVKNGEKLSDTYDPNDPGTWGTCRAWDDELQQYVTKPCFMWTSVAGEQRINEINARLSSGRLYGSLNVSGCTALEYLSCYSNNLTELDVSGCTALEGLFCYSNNLTELDITQNTALEELSCTYNNLSELDVTQNTALRSLGCSSNNLSELDVTNNTALKYLECFSNNLTELDVTQNAALESLWCDANNLTELDVTQNTELTWLWCSSNNLTELDVSNNTALKYLECFSNSLTELDVSNNTALSSLGCSGNNLSELNVTQNIALWDLACYSNNLTELDLSNNPHLILDGIRADGRGFIGYVQYEYDGGGYDQLLFASPMNGASFDGFYDENGELISEGVWSGWCDAYCYSFEDTLNGTVIARFSGGSAVIPGDVDSNGSVTTADAITTLRLALQLIDGSGMNVDAADMDGNGSISIADAIMVLRTALGLA